MSLAGDAGRLVALLQSFALVGAAHAALASKEQLIGQHASALAVDRPEMVAEASVLDHWTLYHVALPPLLLLLLLLLWLSRPKLDAVTLPEGFKHFQATYLSVWGIAVAADWLQGPYVYALYESYGYSRHDISVLFVSGFAASMLFGTFVGSLADTFGRKRSALLYCFLYLCSCTTKHFNSYGALMVGRITGGIATSLLFSTFECWMISEHRQRHDFSEPLLKHMFSLMFLVQYATAIVTGLVAQIFASRVPLTRIEGTLIHYGGVVLPFDLSILCCVVSACLICLLWQENYGEASREEGVAESFRAAIVALRSSWTVAAVGCVVACFEGSMYSFVLNWTPALESSAAVVPHGVIFSGFMMAAMSGSALFGILHPETSATTILMILLTVSAVVLGLVSAVVELPAATWVAAVVFAMFVVFEFCVGIYFPAIGHLKSAVVPERARAGVYNAYRVPLNLVVILLQLTNLPLGKSFGLTSLLLGAALAIVVVFDKGSAQKTAKSLV